MKNVNEFFDLMNLCAELIQNNSDESSMSASNAQGKSSTSNEEEILFRKLIKLI